MTKMELPGTLIDDTAGGNGLILFHAAHSTCSQKVRLCLAEKGLGYQSRVLKVHDREHQSAEYLAINPNGVVPTLMHHDDIIIDSSVICEYLDEVFQAVLLTPQNPVERARMRAWLRYLEEVPTAAIRIPSINLLFVPSINKHDEEYRKDMTEQAPLRRHLYRRIGKNGFSEVEFNESIERLRSTLERAEVALASSPWLIGDRYSLADILLTPIAARLEDLDLSSMWDDLPKFADWYDRIIARPSFKAAFYPGSRVTAQKNEIF